MLSMGLILLLNSCTKESNAVYTPKDGSIPKVYYPRTPEVPVPNPQPATYPPKTTTEPPFVYQPDTSREDAKIKLFYEIDKDKNHKVSAREYLDYCIYRTRHWNDKFIKYYIEQHDKNADGKLTQAEADYEKFVEMDKNHDGFLTLSEINLYRRGIDRKVVVTPLPSQEERRASRIASIQKIIRFCDTDHDDKISLQEGTNDRCDSMTREEFARHDIDHDGYITVKDVDHSTDNSNTNSSSNEVSGYADMPTEIRLIFCIGACDKDLNSHLDEKEMTSEECGFSKQDFKNYDYDQDNWYTKEDLNYKYYMRTFYKADIDKDKSLDLGEFKVRYKYGKIPY